MFHLTIDRSLELTLLEGRHAPVLFSLVDGNRKYLRRWLPWLDANTQVDDSRAFINDARERYTNREGMDLGIWYRGNLAGMVGFYDFEWRDRRANLGYWLAEPIQGKGVMTRSCSALVSHALGELDLNRVEIRCSPRNLRSRAIPARLGFTREGLVRQVEWLYDRFEDHEIYGLLADEWEGTP